MIESNWIIALQSDLLTSIFEFFPLLASDYFYITILAFGYWIAPTSLIFRALGFLIPFSTLLNCLLKNLFRIPRPEKILHLVDVGKSFGFPSGDVQVAFVFWGFMMLHFKSKWLNSLSVFIIISIAFSRVYLGVHTIYDVVGGVIFGSIILFLWSRYLKSSMNTHFDGKVNINLLPRYFLQISAVAICTFSILSYDIEYAAVALISIGALFGLGISAWCKRIFKIEYYKMNVFQATVSFLMLIILALKFPAISDIRLLFCINIVIKYMFIVICIFILFPYLQSIIKRNLSDQRKKKV